MRENCTFRLSGGRRLALQWAPPPTRQAERASPKARTLAGRLKVETSDRPCGRISRCLAFGATGKGEARTALLEGTEAGAADSITKATGVGAKDRQRLIQRTAVYGPVCTVVWEGRSRKAPPYPDWRAPASRRSSGGRYCCEQRFWR